MKKISVFVIVFLCIAGGLSACNAVGVTATPSPTPVITTYKDLSVAEGRLVPGNKLDLSFINGGRVKEVIAKDGDKVESGQVLAILEGEETFKAQAAASQVEQLDSRNALQKLKDDALLENARASMDLEKARDEYDKAADQWHMKSNDRVTAFDTALDEYVKADDAVYDAQKKQDNLTNLAKDAPAREQAQDRLDREITRRDKAFSALLSDYEKPKEGGLDNKRTRLIEAIARLESARFHLNKLDKGVNPDTRDLLQARLDSAVAAQSAAGQQIRDLQLTSPWAGTLSNWDLRVGQTVSPSNTVGTLADTSFWMVETTDLAEDDVVDMKVGDTVNMTINALPGKTFSGVIESIHAKGEKIQGDMTYVVHIKVDQSDPQFYWNMTVKILNE